MSGHNTQVLVVPQWLLSSPKKRPVRKSSEEQSRRCQKMLVHRVQVPDPGTKSGKLRPQGKVGIPQRYRLMTVMALRGAV